MKTPILITLILSMVLLTGCTTYYDSSDEVFDLEFSGDFRDLTFCNVGFVGQDGYGKGHFSFIGISGDNGLECKRIQSYCDSYDNCDWSIKVSAGSNEKSNKWKPTWSGSCYCYDREVNQ